MDWYGNMKEILKSIIAKMNKGQSSRVLIYMMSQIVLQGIAVIAMPLFTRLLTTEQYGRVAVYSTWVSILVIMIGLRVDSTISVAKVHFGESEFKKFCTNAYFIIVATGIVMVAAAGLCLNSLSSLFHLSPYIVLFMVFHAAGTVCTKVQSGIFLITKKAVKDISLSITLSLSACLISVLCIYLMRGHEGEGRILGMGLPYIVLGFVFCAIYMRKIIDDFDKDMLNYILSLSLPMILSGLSALILSQSDRIMISELLGDDKTGIYSFCYSVATPISAIWSALGSAWRPDYYEKLKEQNGEWLKEHSDNYMFLFTSLTCGYLLVAGEALKILGTKDYWPGIKVMPLVIVGIYFEFLYSFPVNYETYCKKTKVIGVASALSAAMNIGLNLWLIPIYGMLGAAIATFASYLILFLIHDFVARRMEGYHYNWGFYIKGLIPVLICCIITYVFSDFMVVRWGIGAVIAVVLIKRILKKRTLL